MASNTSLTFFMVSISRSLWGTRIIEALTNMSRREFSNPSFATPSMGWPPIKVKPFCSAISQQGSHTARFTPAQSTTTAPLWITAAWVRTHSTVSRG